MPPTRENKIIKWLSDIDNDINQIYNIFNYKLISTEDIGEENHKLIIKQLTDLSITLSDILFDIEDKYSRG
jgi:hypothetical protein